jgi:hypothetical protein
MYIKRWHAIREVFTVVGMYFEFSADFYFTFVDFSRIVDLQ